MKLPAKKYYLCLIFLLSSAFSYAQMPVKTEEKELFFDIYYAYRENDTSIVVFIDGALGLGIKKGNNCQRKVCSFRQIGLRLIDTRWTAIRRFAF